MSCDIIAFNSSSISSRICIGTRRSACINGGIFVFVAMCIMPTNYLFM